MVIENPLNYLQHFEVLRPEQFGFMKKSTVYAIANVMGSTVDEFENNKHGLSILHDLSEAVTPVQNGLD